MPRIFSFLILLTFEAAAAAPLLVPKWSLFETTFKSEMKYSNPYKEVDLKVKFISPEGTEHVAGAFWTGGSEWKVRFAPDQIGKWRFKTVPSQAGDSGLQDRSGEFYCVAPKGETLLQQHGPLVHSRDRLHFQHQDGTPFFWIGWNPGPSPKDWKKQVASAPPIFNVIHASILPSENKGLLFRSEVHLNLSFFNQWDQRIKEAADAGLFVAAELFRDPFPALPPEEITRLLEYMVRRWDSFPLLWIPLAGAEWESAEEQWKNPLGTAFHRARSPVTVFSKSLQWAARDLQSEDWIGFYSYSTGGPLNKEGLSWLQAGPVAQQWKKLSPRPILNLHASAADPALQRRIWYWSLLGAPTAGLSTAYPKTTEERKALSLLKQFFDQVDFQKLRPAPELVVNQPGRERPESFVAAAKSPDRSVTVVYVPESKQVELRLEAVPPGPKIRWLNPSTGHLENAVAVVSSHTIQFPTPGPGDWLLILQQRQAAP